MGLFSGISQRLAFGRKCGVARELIRARLSQIPRIDAPQNAHIRAALMTKVDRLSTDQVVSSPEFSALTIAETFAALIAKGVSQADALMAIEAHRASAGVGDGPAQMNLWSYIEYRVALEHPNAQLVTDAWFALVEAECREFFGLELLARKKIDDGVRICRVPPGRSS